MNKTNQIVERTRNRKGHPNGVLVARKLNGNTFVIGWSLCNKNDSFDMNTGINLAFGRTVTQENVFPHSISKQVVKFVSRCERYFKGCRLANEK